MHHFEVQLLGATEKLTLTATVLEARWAEIGVPLAKAVREVELEAPPPRAERDDEAARRRTERQPDRGRRRQCLV
jgi:hypothetical protein